jgi:hypothetical protein
VCSKRHIPYKSLELKFLTLDEQKNSSTMNRPRIDHLVLDTGPLLVASFSTMLADNVGQVYTVQGVIDEVKDSKSKQALALWKSNIVVRNPTPEYISHGEASRDEYLII